MARRILNLHDAAEKVLMHCIAGLLHGRVKMSDMSGLLGPIGVQMVPLKQQDPEKALKKLLDMASRRPEACFLAELVDGNGLAGHTVCLGRGVILDPAETHETHEIALTTQNLDRCTGPYSICVGLKHVHELINKPLAKPYKFAAVFPDGSVYDGEDGEELVVLEVEWRDGKRRGQAKVTYPDGGVYDGEWDGACGKRHGQGKFLRSDGSLLYDGEWRDDKCHGQGKFTNPDGGVYDGEFQDDKRHGQGK